jgi:hypothetical protein
VQTVFPVATRSIDLDAAKEENTQDDFHPALNNDDEDDVGAERTCTNFEKGKLLSADL